MTDEELENLSDQERSVYNHFVAVLEKLHEDLCYDRGLSFESVQEAIRRKLQAEKNNLLRLEAFRRKELVYERRLLAFQADIAARHFGVEFKL